MSGIEEEAPNDLSNQNQQARHIYRHKQTLWRSPNFEHPTNCISKPQGRNTYEKDAYYKEGSVQFKKELQAGLGSGVSLSKKI